MHIIHGTWIPEDTEEFLQTGAFYLWVETDAPSINEKKEDSLHPRHLMGTPLTTFLSEKLGLRPTLLLHTKYFLLPTVAGKPLPSFELLRYVDEEIPEDLLLEYRNWQICCYQLPDVSRELSDIHFNALNAAEDLQLGADLLFWYQYTQVLKGIIAKDQYIPALKYQELPVSKGKQAKGTTDALKRVPTSGDKSLAGFAIHPGWELLSDTYEKAIQRYSAAMPIICTAGGNDFQNAALLAREPLLRHYAECLLSHLVIGTPFTQKFDQQIADTLLYSCLYPDKHLSPKDRTEELEDYKRWLAWRTNFTRAHTEAGFTLCFRLKEAVSSDVDNWQLQFLVAAKHDPSLKMSLVEYWQFDPEMRVEMARPFGQDFEKNLLLALGYAARIYPTIWEGLATDEPISCQLPLDGAFAFLKESAWVLEEAGYTVIVPAWWTPEGRQRAKIRLKTSRSSKGSSAAASRGHFNLGSLINYQYQLSIGGQVVTEEEWQQLVDAKSSLVQFRGQWMELDRDKMQQLLQFWQSHQHENPELTFADMLKLAIESEDDMEWDHDQMLQDMLSQLQDKSAFAPIDNPANLRGTLRDYQKRGVAWLRYLESLGLNPCLADDMGLGKTLEVIACLVMERETNVINVNFDENNNGRDGIGSLQNDKSESRAGDSGSADLLPTLVIAPTSVLGNWHREIERFAPQLRVLVHQGSTRIKEKKAFIDACQGKDVVLTSFALARLDEKLLRSLEWQRIVVDEAQNIKNPQAGQTKAILKLEAQRRWALTGTPVENRLRDLWSIFNFLNPGYLGKETHFRKTFETPIHKENDLAKSTTLKKLVEPFILRRVKTDKRIIDDLPDKIEQKMYCTLTPEQASLYEAVVQDVERQLNDTEGIQRKGLILATLLKLKQICNHPAQFLQDGSAFTTDRSHKLQRLGEMMEEVIESGESSLIFTQFTEIGGALEKYLAHVRHYNTYYLHGGTNVTRRDRMVTEFQDPETEPSIFILSLRAGGVGLNLTKANHVIHFDRWWNPAVEDQATDRAFRIGQRKNVFVHKYVAMGTLEERIDAMIEDKKQLSALVMGADESWLTELDNDTFRDLIALRRTAIVD